jgi:D-alanyl-D-alanine carboxypeptidase
MRLAHIFLIFLMCFVTTADAKSRKKPKISANPPAYSAIVIDAHTGKVLHNEQADKITFPASLTKMMTLYLLFEAIEKGKISPQAKLRVSVEASRQGPTKLYLKAGDRISVRDALLGLMTKSANDAAVVVAEGIAGTEANFAARMTAKARALGMTNTTFKNASGLPNPEQKTTARDMAILSLALYKHYPKYYAFFRTKSFIYRGQQINNHNHLLGVVPGLDGIKTGWIVASGWNLSASAARSGQRVIAVVLGGKTRLWRDKRVSDLIEYGFQKIGVTGNPAVPLPETRPAMAFQADANAVAEPEPEQAQEQAQAQASPVVVKGPAKAVADAAVPVVKGAPKSKGRVKQVPAPVSETVAAPGKWGVQVGAFGSSKKAKEVANKVKSQVAALSGAKVVITPIKHTRGKLYQTRLVNVSESVARKACGQVVKQGHSCMPLRVSK